MNAQADNSDRNFWRRYQASAAKGMPGPVDEAMLAAYLDGQADEEAIERVESQMACDAAFLAEVLELRQMRAASAELPEALRRRLVALSAPPPATLLRHPGRLWWAGAAAWGRRLTYSAAAAAVVVACLAGYTLGQDMFRARQPLELSPARSAGAIEDMVSEPVLEMPGANGRSSRQGGNGHD